jgi:rod shape-determining protein MreD
MRVLGILLALVIALSLQTTLAGLRIGSTTAVNLVLVAVVYAALAFGPVAGMLTGAVGGILQDALAGGIVGIGGFSKTLVGFLIGVLGAQFIVSQAIPRAVMFVGATIVHEACFQALFALTESTSLRLSYPAVLTQAGVNAVVGILAFYFVETGPGFVQRRRARGASLSRRQF